MLKKLLFIIICCISLSVKAQDQEKERVQNTIVTLFKGMATKDSAVLKSVMHPNARLQSAGINKDGKSMLQNETVANFIKQISSIPANTEIEERILSYEIRVDGNLATAWTPYQFYVNGNFSHCGIDAFQLFKDDKGEWKIIQIADTRRKEGCGI